MSSIWVREALSPLRIEKERIFMEDEAIIALYWQRSEEAIVQTQKKYGPYCHWALF